MYFVVGCDYFEEDNTQNTDPVAGVFTTLTEAVDFAQQLKSEPEVYKTWVTKSETDPDS